MEKNVIDIKKDESNMFNDIDFNKDEIMETEETFFYKENMTGGSENSLNLDEDENSVSSDKLDLCDKSMEEEMNKVTLNDKDNKDYKNEDKKDLNKIPLPIFECIYCANEKVAFNHLINEEFYLKYLYNTEKKDIFLIDYLIENKLVYFDKDKNLKIKKALDKSININKLKNIIKMILINTENFQKFYHIDESKKFLKQKRKRDKYNYDDKNKELKLEFNSEEKYGQEKIKNPLFDDDTNDKEDSYEKIKRITQNIIQNTNLVNQKLDKSTEDNLCKRFNRLFDDDDSIDLKRKIKWDDIKFEEKPYNIWEINSVDDESIGLEENS